MVVVVGPLLAVGWGMVLVGGGGCGFACCCWVAVGVIAGVSGAVSGTLPPQRTEIDTVGVV